MRPHCRSARWRTDFPRPAAAVNYFLPRQRRGSTGSSSLSARAEKRNPYFSAGHRQRARGWLPAPPRAIVHRHKRTLGRWQPCPSRTKCQFRTKLLRCARFYSRSGSSTPAILWTSATAWRSSKRPTASSSSVPTVAVECTGTMPLRARRFQTAGAYVCSRLTERMCRMGGPTPRAAALSEIAMPAVATHSAALPPPRLCVEMIGRAAPPPQPAGRSDGPRRGGSERSLALPTPSPVLCPLSSEP